MEDLSLNDLSKGKEEMLKIFQILSEYTFSNLDENGRQKSYVYGGACRDILNGYLCYDSQEKKWNLNPFLKLKGKKMFNDIDIISKSNVYHQSLIDYILSLKEYVKVMDDQHVDLSFPYDPYSHGEVKKSVKITLIPKENYNSPEKKGYFENWIENNFEGLLELIKEDFLGGNDTSKYRGSMDMRGMLKFFFSMVERRRDEGIYNFCISSYLDYAQEWVDAGFSFSYHSYDCKEFIKLESEEKKESCDEEKGCSYCKDESPEIQFGNFIRTFSSLLKFYVGSDWGRASLRSKRDSVSCEKRTLNYPKEFESCKVEIDLSSLMVRDFSEGEKEFPLEGKRVSLPSKGKSFFFILSLRPDFLENLFYMYFSEEEGRPMFKSFFKDGYGFGIPRDFSGKKDLVSHESEKLFLREKMKEEFFLHLQENFPEGEEENFPEGEEENFPEGEEEDDPLAGEKDDKEFVEISPLVPNKHEFEKEEMSPLTPNTHEFEKSSLEEYIEKRLSFNYCYDGIKEFEDNDEMHHANVNHISEQRLPPFNLKKNVLHIVTDIDGESTSFGNKMMNRIEKKSNDGWKVFVMRKFLRTRQYNIKGKICLFKKHTNWNTIKSLQKHSIKIHPLDC